MMSKVYRVNGREVVSTRGSHTAEQRAWSILRHLVGHYERLFPDQGPFEQMFDPLWHDMPADGDDVLFHQWLGDSADAELFRSTHTPEQFALMLAVMYAIQAIQTDRAGNHLLAWDYALDAAQHEGNLAGMSGIARLPAGDEEIQRLKADLDRQKKAHGHNKGQVEARVQLCRDLHARYKETAKPLFDRISKAVNCSDGSSWDDPEGPAIRRVFKLAEHGRIEDLATGMTFDEKSLIELINYSKRPRKLTQ